MVTDVLRPFWLKGLNAITGTLDYRFLSLITKRKGYVIYDQLLANRFKLTITDTDSVLRSIAADVNRFGCASIESMNEIYYNPKFPHSHAWKCIKSYYAAYYAAHAILRMLGTSCTNFEKLDLAKVETLADAYGLQNGISITKGYYKCHIDIDNNLVDCNKISTSGNLGSHEQLWLVFLNSIKNVITELGQQPISVQNQAVIVKLCDLRDNLIYLNSDNGNFLSRIRNEINYKQSDGLWYPYKELEKYFSDIQTMTTKWVIDPMLIDIDIYSGKQYLRFISTCVFLVSLSRSMAVDMSDRCPKGKNQSFIKYGSLSLISKINT